MKRGKKKKPNRLTLLVILSVILLTGLLVSYVNKSKSKLLCSKETACGRPKGVCMPGGVCLN